MRTHRALEERASGNYRQYPHGTRVQAISDDDNNNHSLRHVFIRSSEPKKNPAVNLLSLLVMGLPWLVDHILGR